MWSELGQYLLLLLTAFLYIADRELVHPTTYAISKSLTSSDRPLYIPGSTSAFHTAFMRPLVTIETVWPDITTPSDYRDEHNICDGSHDEIWNALDRLHTQHQTLLDNYNIAIQHIIDHKKTIEMYEARQADIIEKSCAESISTTLQKSITEAIGTIEIARSEAIAEMTSCAKHQVVVCSGGVEMGLMLLSDVDASIEKGEVARSALERAAGEGDSVKTGLKVIARGANGASKKVMSEKQSVIDLHKNAKAVFADAKKVTEALEKATKAQTTSSPSIPPASKKDIEKAQRGAISSIDSTGAAAVKAIAKAQSEGLKLIVRLQDDARGVYAGGLEGLKKDVEVITSDATKTVMSGVGKMKREVRDVMGEGEKVRLALHDSISLSHDLATGLDGISKRIQEGKDAEISLSQSIEFAAYQQTKLLDADISTKKDAIIAILEARSSAIGSIALRTPTVPSQTDSLALSALQNQFTSLATRLENIVLHSRPPPSPNTLTTTPRPPVNTSGIIPGPTLDDAALGRIVELAMMEYELEKRRENVSADEKARKAWPAEWPIYWESGDPTGLGRAPTAEEVEARTGGDIRV